MMAEVSDLITVAVVGNTVAAEQTSFESREDYNQTVMMEEEVEQMKRASVTAVVAEISLPLESWVTDRVSVGE